MIPKVLLTSVFKPFAVNDIYSRKESIIELLHNQLTKVQGIYSLRTFYDSYGIHAIANNLGIPCTVLDFPTQKRFLREIEKGYDFIGISSIVHNFQKVKWMVEQIRKKSPRSKIIIGGFCASIPNLQKILDVDYVCIGEGISFMRALLGLPEKYTFKNPDVKTDLRELLGVPLFGIPKIPPNRYRFGMLLRLRFLQPKPLFRQKTYPILHDGQGSVRSDPTRVRILQLGSDIADRRRQLSH